VAIKIYAFFYFDNETKRYFYVGRSNNLKRRMREHTYSKAIGHKDKYARIRQLDGIGTPWRSEVIEELPDTSYLPDAERWHVIRLTRAGHDLLNMRHGSVQHRKVLAEQIRSLHTRRGGPAEESAPN
jgi:hypothetical protein